MHNKMEQLPGSKLTTWVTRSEYLISKIGVELEWPSRHWRRRNP
jgi:hypothetical protein